MKLSLLPILVSFVLCGACGESYVQNPHVATSDVTTTSANAEHVTGPQAKALVKSGAKLVDVRSPGEFAAGHIEGAINVPVDGIANADLGPKDTQIVLYCHTGRRTARAAEALRQRGYTNVHELGPMENWNAQ